MPKKKVQENNQAPNDTSKKPIIKKPPIVFSKTQLELNKLSQLLGCKVLSYFKPTSGSIWSEDLYAMLECLKNTGQIDTLAIYIRSNGGDGKVSLRMINLLRSFAKKIILLAPFECASAATMLALECDTIYMGPLSILSPVDSSLTHQLSPNDKLNQSVPISLDEVWRVLRLWKEAEKDNFNPINKTKETKNIIQKDSNSENTENPYKYLYEYIHPLVFGAIDRYSSLSVRVCKEILSYHIQDEKLIDSIIYNLNYDYPSHSYPITMIEAKKIGLPIKEINAEMASILNNLQLLYSELTQEKVTDYDNLSYHDNSIYSVIESQNTQIVYQWDHDKFYRESEKRYITINDLTGWYKSSFDKNNKIKREKLYF